MSSATGNHFSCSLSAVLLRRVDDFGGDEAVAEVLRRAESRRPLSDLMDVTQWISYDEAVALWRAGAEVTHHPQFARAVGEDSVRRLNGSPVADLLRSLGSPENVYRQIATTAGKYSRVSVLEAVRCAPGVAEIDAVAIDGFERHVDHCRWTMGLLSQPVILFGLPPAHVEHTECAAFGAQRCRYVVTWGQEQAFSDQPRIEHLQRQLDAMRERLQSVFQTAADLIGAGDLDQVLARIADRAAVEVRAHRHLLAVRMTEGGPLHCHHKGFAAGEVDAYVARLAGAPPGERPDTWLVAPVRSNRRDYGHLLAMYDDGVAFLPPERELLEVYARYAASALDGAAALDEAERRFAQSSALLELARALAGTGASAEIAHRLAGSVQLVVDCDQVGVYLWDAGRGELVRQAATSVGDDGPSLVQSRTGWTPTPGGTLDALLREPDPAPIFLDETTGDPTIAAIFSGLGFGATILVPLASPSQLLGLLTVSVKDRAERLAPAPDLLDRLSGVAAQATTALENGRLVDLITHQALHDQLTGLANRLQFTDALDRAVTRAATGGGAVTLLYLDLDRFKPVNDEFGHETGDELLAAVGRRLQACTRPGDTVARLGGDEFAVLIVDATAGEADAVALRISAGFRRPYSIRGHRLSLGVSIGRAAYPGDGADADGLLRNADAAMFARKRARRSQLAPVGPRRAAV